MKTTWAVDPKERIWPVDSIEMVFKMHEYIPMFTRDSPICSNVHMNSFATHSHSQPTLADVPKTQNFQGFIAGFMGRTWWKFRTVLVFVILFGSDFWYGLHHGWLGSSIMRVNGKRLSIDPCGVPSKLRFVYLDKDGDGEVRLERARLMTQPRGIDCANTHCWKKQR